MSTENAPEGNTQSAVPVNISDDDVIEAMREIGGYLDITPGDLKEILKIAYRQAVRRIAGSVRAGDIMTKDVHYVLRDAPAADVVDMMATWKVSGLPVVGSSGNVVGVISAKDILSQLGPPEMTHVMAIISGCLKGERCLALPLKGLMAEDVMTSPAITIDRNITLFQIMELFAKKNINRAPVVGENGALEGIVSRADVLRAPLPGVHAIENLRYSR